MYDYVIVGAGSAGCVLAARLSEDPDVKVLLLEAGGPDTKENIHVPLGYLQLQRTDVDWDYVSAPEEGCGGRRLPLPRGKVLGGSSSINAMVYIRGNPRDYDDWNAEGWGWNDLFPYFLKAEDNERGASEWHGAGGPLPVSDLRSGMALSPAWVEAGAEAGLERNEDFNGARQDGVGTYQVTQRDGMRASAAVAYLHPAMAQRENLTVMPFMQAHRVVFEGTRAVAVEASRLGEVQELRAEREVILCSGSFNSPQLLMLSGIGPAEHLAMREIETLIDQPAVGQNLSDHACVWGVWTSEHASSLLDALEPAALSEFEASKTGPFTSNFAEAGGFARVGSGADAPDIQFHTVPLQIVDEGFRDPEAHGVWASACLLTPESRGEVTLANNDPFAKPIIRNRFYSEGTDLERTVAGLRLVLEICGQPALREFCSQPSQLPADGSEEALRAHVARTTFPIYHPAGTCAIGSVVDERLCVQGTEALRVVDCSVMPAVPRGNTNAPVIALAERAADLIRGEAPLGREQDDAPAAAGAASE
jgi:choline dehydrogenase-like flavoprotein